MLGLGGCVKLSFPPLSPFAVLALRYDPAAVGAAHAQLGAALADGGLLLEGTSDELGRRWVVHALRRRYPQIYESDDKLVIDPSQVAPTRVDFRAAMEAITPASHRAAQAHARPLGALRRPLMGETLARALDGVRRAFPPAAMAHEAAPEPSARRRSRSTRTTPTHRTTTSSWTSSGARTGSVSRRATGSVSRRPPTRRRSSS